MIIFLLKCFQTVKKSFQSKIMNVTILKTIQNEEKILRKALNFYFISSRISDTLIFTKPF